MGRQHHRGRAKRLDSLRPGAQGTDRSHERDGAAYRQSADACLDHSGRHARSSTDGHLRRGAVPGVSWEQLRRRKVGHWAVLYATGAWGFLQGVGYVTELFGWPTELPRVVAFALLTGLPAVIVVAWFHGDRGDQRVSGTELTLVTVLFLLGGGAFWAYQQAGSSVDRAYDEHSQPSPPVEGDSRPVVAVLPFENRNDLAEDAHFVDGVHDYVLTQLAKAEALHVVARTSVTKFRGSQETTQQIATALGATVLVEGAVQRSGSRVRVTVQLVDGGSALHLWAEHYDLDLSTTNALEVQSELGVAVSEAVKNRLTGNRSDRRVAVSVPTHDVTDGAVVGSVVLP